MALSQWQCALALLPPFKPKRVQLQAETCERLSSLPRCRMNSPGVQAAVVDKLQLLLSQAQPLTQQLSSIADLCDSLADDVAAARESPLLVLTAPGPDGDACLIGRRKEFLDQLSRALAALQESQDACRDIESSGTAGASRIISQTIAAVRAIARASACLDLMSSGPYSGSGVACNARAHHRSLSNSVFALVKQAPRSCIKTSGSSGILLGKDCLLLQQLQHAVLECAPSHAHALVQAIADDLAAIVTEDVFNASVCIEQVSTPAGVALRAVPHRPSAAPAMQHDLSAFADSLHCIARAVRSSLSSSASDAEPSLAASIVSAVVQRAGYNLCTFAANRAGNFSQAQIWSGALQQLPPHAAANGAPAASYWQLWADRRSVDAVAATQQQLSELNAEAGCRQQLCNAVQCVHACILALISFSSDAQVRVGARWRCRPCRLGGTGSCVS
jgi:hypothetical protein